MFFLRINLDIDRIVGWQRSPSLPSPPVGMDHIVVDENDPIIIILLANMSWPKGGPFRWRWINNSPQEVADPRFPVRVIQTPNPGLVGQALTVKLEVLKADGNVRRNLNTTTTVQLLDQNGRLRRMAVNIAAGVAERTFTPSESGEIELLSDEDRVVFQGDNPVVVDEAW